MSAPAPPGVPLDLASCAVLVDFDGTISVEDVGIVVLERFCAGRYEEVDRRYERGEIGSREYVRALWRLLDGVPEAELLAAARAVPLDPGFGSLVRFLHARGAQVTVVSDGIGSYVATRVAAFGVDVRANEHDGRRARFPFAWPSCPSSVSGACGTCGTCKVAPVEAAHRQGRTAILVGDGTSDRFGAAAADLVFAKERLAEWCTQWGSPFVPYDELAEVEAELRARGGA